MVWWVAETAKFRPDLRVATYHGTRRAIASPFATGADFSFSQSAADAFRPTLSASPDVAGVAVNGLADQLSRDLQAMCTTFASWSSRVVDAIYAEVVHLNGAMELAPGLGLSRVIVDLVQTGSTLKANGLVETEVIAQVTSRLSVNRTALKTRPEAIGGLGLTEVDLVLVLEESGRFALPEPIVETAPSRTL